MNLELLIAIISGVFALTAGVIAVYGQRTNTKFANELEVLKINRQEEKEISRYKDPLIKAAYDLQSRLYNILMKDLLDVYYKNGDYREKKYVLESSLFLIAQFFCWTEIIRTEIQFINLGEDHKTKKLSDLLNNISQTFLTDEYDKTLRIFAGEQRALGEIMISERDRLQCIGYNEFKHKQILFDKVDQEGIFTYLKNDIKSLSENISSRSDRLIKIQNYLIDLVDFLDPNFVRYPKKVREKINIEPVA